jgi:hypothetical protein
MNETCVVKDLAIGDVIRVDAFDDPMVVRSAKKIRKGLDAGKLDLALVGPDGEKERIALAPDDRVKVVRNDANSAKARSHGRSQSAKAKPMSKANTSATPKAKAAETATPEPKAKPSRERRQQKKAEGEKKMSCLDAAAKVRPGPGSVKNTK